MNGAKWLSARDEPMYVDMSCFVIVERIVNLKGGVWDAAYQFFDFENLFPTVYDFVKKFQAHELLKDHCIGFTQFDRQNQLQNSMELGVKYQLSNTVFVD